MLTLVTTKTQLSVSDCTLIMSNHLINVIMHLKTYLYVAYKRFFLAFINFISFVQLFYISEIDFQLFISACCFLGRSFFTNNNVSFYS